MMLGINTGLHCFRRSGRCSGALIFPSVWSEELWCNELWLRSCSPRASFTTHWRWYTITTWLTATSHLHHNNNNNVPVIKKTKQTPVCVYNASREPEYTLKLTAADKRNNAVDLHPCFWRLKPRRQSSRDSDAETWNKHKQKQRTGV